MDKKPNQADNKIIKNRLKRRKLNIQPDIHNHEIQQKKEMKRTCLTNTCLAELIESNKPRSVDNNIDQKKLEPRL